jgi:hypothetical protein
VNMIELTEEQASVLKRGYPVRVFVRELGGDVVVVLGAQGERTESVLQEMLDEIREPDFSIRWELRQTFSSPPTLELIPGRNRGYLISRIGRTPSVWRSSDTAMSAYILASQCRRTYGGFV